MALTLNSDDEHDIDSFCSNDSQNSDLNISSLSNCIEAKFINLHSNFNIVHINAQSIPAHFPDLLASFNQVYIHAILISESWLKPCLSNVAYSLPGYTLIRNDRVGAAGGGVAIYLRNNIPFSIVSMSPQPPQPDSGEFLFIEVTLYHTKLLLGVYYSPSLRINYFSSFENLLFNLIPQYNHSIIMGDFNTCLLKRDTRSLSLENVANSSNLTILPLTSTHHLPNAIPSLLDLMLVSSPAHVIKHGQMSAEAFSYHDLIYLSYNVRPPKNKSKVFLQRNFGGINLERLRRDAQNLDWSGVTNAVSIDEKVHVFNTTLMELYNLHAPLRQIKIKHLPAPWLTEDIRSLMNIRNKAKTKYKRQPTELNKESFIRARNRCNRECRDAQRRFIHTSVQNENPAKVWRFLKSLGVGKSPQNIKSDNIDINLLNQHFAAPSYYSQTIKSSTLQVLSSIPTPQHSPFRLTQFTDCDVVRAVKSITSNAIGSDGISRNMVLPILDVISPILSHILNFSVTTSSFPTVWKEAQITPLPKKPHPLSFSDFRPISILPFLSKVLERLVHEQLSIFLNKNSLMNPFQSGFRPGHSTTTALIKITDDIREGMDKGLITVLSLLDFSSAFNNVDFDLLLEILRSLNISPTVVDWLRSYLYGRQQRIRIDETYSSWQGLTAGVPQGGVLSPLLFAIFINSISSNLSSSYHLYADDLQIYTQAPREKLNEAVSVINNDLDRVLSWSRAHGLKVNPNKTQAIVIGSSRMLSKINWSLVPHLVFDGTHILFSGKVKNLGVIIDKELSWWPHITELSRRIFASSASLRRLKFFLPIPTKITLAQSLLLSVLDYADACYLDLTVEQLDKLERLQNFCIRFIFGLKKYDHVSDYRKQLKWLSIRLRRNAHILHLLYCILFIPSTPPYLKERFGFLHASHTLNLRSSYNLTLQTPAHTSSFYNKSFTVQAVQLWNSLPENIRRAKSLTSFKSQVKEYYLSL